MDRVGSMVETLRTMLESPITLVMIVITFFLSMWRGSWWMPAIVALVADAVSALVLYKHWQRVGIDVGTQIWQGALLFAAYTYFVYALVRLIIAVQGNLRKDR